MKKLQIIFLILPFLGFSQIDFKKEAKNDLEILKMQFEKSFEAFTKSKDTLVIMSQRLDSNLTNYYKKVTLLKRKVDSLYEASVVVWSFYKQKGVARETLNKIFTIPRNYLTTNSKNQQTELNIEPAAKNEVYLFFGNNKLVLKDKIVENSEINEIFGAVLNNDSESHLGDFWFPKDKQEIPLVKRQNLITGKRKLFGKRQTKLIYKSLLFNKIEIEINEGSLIDIKVFLKDKKGNNYLFENRLPISLLRYTLNAHNFFLKNESTQTLFGKDDYKGYRLRLSDVLRYSSKPGRNFIPDNQSLSFPILNDTNKKSNTNASNIYELRQSTALENVIDLRAYTDFLGLFGETSNGIAQFEGQAEFFINPFRIFKDNPIYIFKKIRPYVAYSRLDEENQFLETVMINNSDSLSLKNRLDHLQRSSLDLGVTTDVISLRFTKEMPFEFQLFGALRYQVARVRPDSINTFNYKTLGIGGGVNLEFKRFDNFDLRLASEFTYYNQNSFNDISNFVDSGEFWVWRNEAELSYFPSSSPKNAIFLRLRVFSDADSEIDSSFFQFQFGYKFSVGAKKVKNKIN